LKNSHSLETKLRYLFDDKQIAVNVPRSTKQYWKKSKSVKDFCCNNLWGKFEELEPMKLLFENKNLQEQYRLLALTTKGLFKTISIQKLTSQQKDEIVSTIDKLTKLCSLAKACSYFSISTQKYYAWKNKNECHQSVITLCKKKIPNQLTDIEIGLIKKYMNDLRYIQWSRASVYWQLCKSEGHLFAKSTFYKYCNALGYCRRKGADKCKKNTVGVKATAVGEIIHADITAVFTHKYEKANILFLQDNFSRKIVGFHVAKENNTLLQAATIKNALTNLVNIGSIMVDGGSENKGAVDIMLKQYFPTIKKIVAKVDIPFANNMIEALHYKIKHQIFPKDGFESFDTVVAKLPSLVKLYNTMPHDSLMGATPNDIFDGILPDINKRKKQLIVAKKIRLNANKEFACCKI
jgi:putative transposase